MAQPSGVGARSANLSQMWMAEGPEAPTWQSQPRPLQPTLPTPQRGSLVPGSRPRSQTPSLNLGSFPAQLCNLRQGNLPSLGFPICKRDKKWSFLETKAHLLLAHSECLLGICSISS